MAGLSGCSQSLTLVTGFPEPVIEPMPLTVGLRYPDTLTDYVHQEAPPLEAEWTIKIGDANKKLFNSLFTAMFTETMHLEPDADPSDYPELDAIIEPTLEEFEFSLPRQSQTAQYAVWLRYNLRVFAPNGDLISNWPVTAYGQVGAKSMAAEESMRQATVLAMRDAAANIAVGFKNAPGIQEKLLKQSDDEPGPGGTGDEPEQSN